MNLRKTILQILRRLVLGVSTQKPRSRPSWFPASATADSNRLVATRALRGLADGAVSVLLPSYLSALGLGATQIGIIVFGTLFGSALVTLWAGLAGQRIGRRKLLLGACGLMMATGLGFIYLRSFWPLFAVALVGTLNPSSGDVSVFLPLEQAALAETVVTRELTGIFAIYNVAGALAGALGALASGLPSFLAFRFGWNMIVAQRSGFVAYSVIALIAAIVYRSLSGAVEMGASPVHIAPLAKSRGIVVHLAMLFSLDAFGWRLRHSVAARTLAFPSLQHVYPGRRGLLFCCRSPWIVIAIRIGRSRRPNRTDQDDGLYACAVQRFPDTRRHDAQCKADARLPAIAVVAITDGRSRSPIIRNGGSAVGRAGSRSKRHKRATQPRSSSGSDSCRDDVGRLLFGMAVDLRRCAKGLVRLSPLTSVPFR